MNWVVLRRILNSMLVTSRLSARRLQTPSARKPNALPPFGRVFHAAAKVQFRRDDGFITSSPTLRENNEQWIRNRAGV